MVDKLIIQALEETDTAYMVGYSKDSKPEYFIKYSISLSSTLESIFLAKVVDINNKNKTAFVNYSEDKIGFVNLNQSKNQNLQKGSQLSCQLTWLGDDSKLAKLEDNINFVGRYVILVNRNIHKFACDKTLEIREIANKYLDYGVIFRSSINSLTDLSIVDDELQQLINKMDEVLRISISKSSVQCLEQGLPFYLQVLRNLRYSEEIHIITNCQSVFDNILPYMDLWQIDQLTIDKRLQTDIVSLNNLVHQNIISHNNYSLEIHKLSGINLIDINSGAGYPGTSKLSFYQVNYLAIEEIVRQIKLRDLSGIILLDFIKNMTFAEKQQIYNRLEMLFKDDWRHVRLLGFTNAEIFEIIRNK
jgi:ribonuclease G